MSNSSCKALGASCGVLVLLSGGFVAQKQALDVQELPRAFLHDLKNYQKMFWCIVHIRGTPAHPRPDPKNMLHYNTHTTWYVTSESPYYLVCCTAQHILTGMLHCTMDTTQYAASHNTYVASHNRMLHCTTEISQHPNCCIAYCCVTYNGYTYCCVTYSCQAYCQGINYQLPMKYLTNCYNVTLVTFLQHL